MNCKDVEELLPLYVGRDLEEERARLVTAHVQACTQCARSAQEYGEANQLLQLFEPPQFSEAIYTAVRSRVLREIEQEYIAPTLREFIARPFQPPVIWGVSTAVLLTICVFAYYFIANRTSGQRYEQANAGTQHDDLNASRKDIKPDLTGTAGGPPALATLSPKSRLNLTAHNGTSSLRPASATSSPKSPLNQTAWHSRRAGGAPAVPVESAQYSPVEPNAGPHNPPVTSEKTLRLEIQTSDPNVRIIWFSHPSTNEGSPNESSKGI